MIQEAWSLIQGAQRVFLIAHVDPDGDTIGSTLALGFALRQMGKRCTFACSDPVPRILSFLPGSEEFGTPSVGQSDLVITVDASDPGRLGEAYEGVLTMGLPVINIDHHVTNTRFATVNLVRPNASSTAEIVFDLLGEWEVEMGSLLAPYLLTGIVTDTQFFSTSSTSPRTLEVASELVRAGASLLEINEKYFKSKDPGTLRLWGRILDLMQVDGRLVWSINTVRMREECQASSDNGNGIVNLLASVQEAAAAIVFKEYEGNRVEISIRSRPGVDISPIAVFFGGGGHPQAAGAVLNGHLETAVPRVLAKASEVLDSQS
ncbi:MAG: bifunctional oligoribonuclease/PAP phosphatase NrnA [Anaerolineae bacterium]|nr:bifunctional oligoribonuclease/PAP phosphatase NrnA [Anaerolineae bacterium]